MSSKESSAMLSGSKVLVTGASSGIGLGICKVLSSQGARVYGSGRNASALDELKSGGQIEGYVVADVTSRSGASGGGSGVPVCKALVDECAEKMGGLTAVVNCAGVLQAGAMGDVAVDNYDYNMNTNARAPFEITTHAVPHLKKAAAEESDRAKSDDGSGVSPCVVNISSVNGKQSFPGCISYCMSKAAVDMMTRCASVDLAKYGVRVNSVNPGMVATNLQKRGGLRDDQYDAFLKRQIEVTHPLASYLGRCGAPEEVGELVAFLISDKAKFITGECIAMDGGRQNLGSR